MLFFYYPKTERGIAMKTFVKCAAIRALKTVAQAAVGALGTTAVISEVDWMLVLGTALTAGVTSLLTSIATGLPECTHMEE